MPISKTFVNKDGEEVILTVEDHERQKCDIYSRVMGYIMPLANWNPGKRSEFAERKRYVPPIIQPPLF